MRNPMQSICGAHCRTTGNPCQNYPMVNGRCRMHGGKSSGRPTINGQFTKNSIQKRQELRQLKTRLKEMVDMLKSIDVGRS